MLQRRSRGSLFSNIVWNFLPANQNPCYRARSFLCNRSRIRDRTPRDFSFGLDPRQTIAVDGRVVPLWRVPGGYAEKVSHSRSGTAMEGGTEPEPQIRPRERLRGRATSGSTEGASPIVVPRGARRMRGRKSDAKFSCLQTPEISQNREIFLRRRGHEDASR
jgi:hypothetical protein